MPLWGIDLGGTKVEGVIIDSLAEPKVILRLRRSTERHKGYQHVLALIHQLVKDMESRSGLKCDKIGIGTPGSRQPDTGLHKNSNTTCLNDQPFYKDLGVKLGIPVFMANDANCFALAEATIGSVQAVDPTAQVVFGVIMGTGVGGGLVVNGSVINGKNGIGGEWGHNYLDASGGPCYCGKTGCVEQVLSGKNLERWHYEQFAEQRKLQEIYVAHLTGKDTNASQTINRLITYFGRALSVVINLVDPDVVVLGGGVGNIDLLYTEGIEEVRKHIFNPQMSTKIIRPKLGDSAGVFGAAFLAA